jgi:NAD(P)H-nitrite reductase large subunit
MHYVVVGAGPAGVIAAETLRRSAPDSEITLIGEESEPPYSRMAIPYYLIEKVGEAGTYLRKDEAHYASLNVRLRHDRVERIDAEQRELTLRSGEKLGYDELLIATGSRAIRPPIPGIDAAGVHTCWTLDDARHIYDQAGKESRVLLIGAGFIGCIVLEALAMRGVDLTVVEMGDRMVPRMMDDVAGNLLKRWCEEKGVKVHTSTSVTEIEETRSGSGKAQSQGGIRAFFSRLTGATSEPEPAAGAAHPLRVTLSDGSVLEADLVISAAGVKPNLELLEGTGVQTDAGIVVDEYFRSSVPHIYAAGDVAEGRDFSTGEHDVHAIQPTASEHGRIAALNMCGHETQYQGSLNMNVLDTLGLISSSFGLWMGVDGGDNVALNDPENFRYLNLQFKDDVLVGAQSLGLTQHVGVLRGLIQGQTPLGDWKEKLKRDPTRIMEAYLQRQLAYQ